MKHCPVWKSPDPGKTFRSSAHMLVHKYLLIMTLNWFVQTSNMNKLMNKICVNLGQDPCVRYFKTSFAYNLKFFSHRIESKKFLVVTYSPYVQFFVRRWLFQFMRWSNWKIDKIAHQIYYHNCKLTIFRYQFHAKMLFR